MDSDKFSRNNGLRTAPKPLTVQSISALKVGSTVGDGAIRPGFGALKVRKRKTASGGIPEWLFRYRLGGKTSEIVIGRFSPREAVGCLTLEQARQRARELQGMVKDGVDPLAQRALARADELARQRAAVVTLRSTETNTLAVMFRTYLEGLRSRGKFRSASDAENMFHNHVEVAFPEIASMPASQVAPEHISRVLARLVGPSVSKPKGRTALKLRSYLSAAFRVALGAGTDPMAMLGADSFGLSINPAAAVPATAMAARFNRVGERVLSPAELRAYMAFVLSLNGAVGAALALQLWGGGQRAQQILRLRHRDVSEGTWTLYDPKGRRSEARRHVLPITREIAEIFSDMGAGHGTPDDLVFVSDRKGKNGQAVGVAPETLSNAVSEFATHMVELQHASTLFRGGDVRRTVETVMSESLRISKDARAQLLSHGLSGVQDRVYDKGTHLDTKREVLIAWAEHLADICLENPGG